MRSKTIFISFLHASLSFGYAARCVVFRSFENWKDFLWNRSTTSRPQKLRGEFRVSSGHLLCRCHRTLYLSSRKALQRCLSCPSQSSPTLENCFSYFSSNIFHPLFAQVFFRSRLCRVHSPALYGMLCVLSFLVRQIRFSTLNQSFKRREREGSPDEDSSIVHRLNALRLIGVMCVSFNCSSSLLRILSFCSKNLFTIFQLSALFTYISTE